MASADKALDTLRRNRTPWSLTRQQRLQVQQVQQVLPQQIITYGDPAIAPLGTEVAPYSTEFDAGVLPSQWQWFNQGTSTATFRSGRLLLTPQVTGGSGTNSARLLVQPVPAGSWTIRTRSTDNSIIVNAGGGIVAYRSANGKFWFQSALARVAGAPMSCRLLTGYWTDVNTFGTVVRDDNPPLLESRLWTMQTRYDGTTLYADYSADNVVFFNVASVSVSTALGGAPDFFGVAANAPTATTPAAAFAVEWFRVYGNSNLNQDA